MINYIKNNKFIKSTIILLFGGFLSKLLGFILKIIITRQIGTTGIGIYSLLGPSMAVLNTLAIFSYPTAISTLIAKRNSSKRIIFSIIPVSILINIFLIVIIILVAPFLSKYLLKEPILYYPIICIGLTLPFIGLSSIIKSYYWGHQNMGPYILSNIVEQIVRIVLLVIWIPKLIKINLMITISVIILVNIISETSSIIVMLLFLPKGIHIKKEDIRIDKSSIKDVMSITIPSTSSKIIGSIFYFFEPIIITNILLYLGYPKTYIINEYGIINGYALSLLLLPSFFTQSMSTSLIPELSKYYSLKDYKKCIKRIKQIVFTSLSIGIISTSIIFIFPDKLLDLLYHTNEGIDYIRILSPFILLYFIEIPLNNSLHALNKSKTVMKITVLGELVRTISLIVFSFFKIGLYSLIISIILNLITSTTLYYRETIKIFKINRI